MPYFNFHLVPNIDTSKWSKAQQMLSINFATGTAISIKTVLVQRFHFLCKWLTTSLRSVMTRAENRVVLSFWSSRIMYCMLFTLENRIPLCGVSVICGRFHCHWWIASIQPRLLFFSCKLRLLRTFPFLRLTLIQVFSGTICLLNILDNLNKLSYIQFLW